MSTTLSKGYILPTDGEKVTWWQNLIYNFTRINSHRHDGVDSEILSLSALARTTSPVSSANWAATGNAANPYKQTITCPSDIDLTKSNLELRDASNEVVYAKIVILTTTTFDIYVNDNTLNMSVIYG